MIRYILLCLCTIAMTTAGAQSPDYEFNNRKSFIISGVPQKILNNAIRLEFDLPRKNNNWITLAPEFYYKATDFEEAFVRQDYNTLIGGGLELLFRKYLYSMTPAEGFYIAYGGGYRYLHINVDHFLWEETTAQQLTWIHRTPTRYNIDYHGLSAKCFGGYQMKLFDFLTSDLYLGLGIRYSIENAPEGNFLKFNKNMSDYGFRGMILVGGLRVGICL